MFSVLRTTINLHRHLIPCSKCRVISLIQFNPNFTSFGSPTTPTCHFSITPTPLGWFFGPPAEESMFRRMKKKLGYTDTPKHKLLRAGYELYIKLADELAYKEFFEICDMEDTYASWFTVMELHIWLLSARVMQDGDEGRVVRNAMIKAMWEDTDTRSKKLEGALSSALKDQIRMMNDQFQASLLGYDEGMQTSDKVLTGALWRRFFRGKDPENEYQLKRQIAALELLVAYMRSQFYKLNQMSRDRILYKRDFQFDMFSKDLLNKMASKHSPAKVSSIDKVKSQYKKDVSSS